MVEAFYEEPLLNQLMLLTKYKHRLSNEKLSDLFLIHRSTVFRRYKKTYQRMKEVLVDES